MIDLLTCEAEPLFVNFKLDKLYLYGYLYYSIGTFDLYVYKHINFDLTSVP